MSQVTLDEVTNKLLLKYDQNFNGLYDKKVGFDSSIMNKEDVIIKENLELLKKDLKIKALQYACILVLLLSALLILHALKKIDTKKLIIASILLIVIYVISMIVLYKDPNIQLKAVSLATGLKLKDYLKSELQDLSPALFSSYGLIGVICFYNKFYFYILFNYSVSGFTFGISATSISAKDIFLLDFVDNGGSFY